MKRAGRQVDSDEEPPAAVVNASVAERASLPLRTDTSAETRFLVSGSESHILDELTEKLQCRYKAMTSLPRCVPAVVSFCVGGRPFAVSKAVIEKDPASLLFLLTLQHFTPLTASSGATGSGRPADSQDPQGTWESAISIPDRNPDVFAMLLNMLRGYKNAIPVDWADHCHEEAVYYGLDKSWNARFHVLPSPYYFRNPMHNSKMLSDAVLGVASDFLVSGEHHIDLSVTQCDRVGVGVISAVGGQLEELGLHAQDGSNGAFYWNDGKLSFYLGEPRMIDSSFPFPAGALIRIAFDADTRIIRWIVNGEYCVAMERLPAGRQYAFACIASRTSQVTIVPL